MSGGSFLAGVRVLDLSRVLAGPFAAQILGDLGAEVLKVEPPSGDDTRAWGPPFQTGEQGATQAAYFQSCNRNKASLVLDFHQPEGRQRLAELLAAVDVVLHNCRPSTAARLGLDEATLRARRPRLVSLGIVGYSGSRREQPGYDLALQAETGWIGMTGPPEAGWKVGVAVVDLVTGMLAASGVLAALLRQARRGEGAVLSLSLYRSSLFSLVNVASNHLVSGGPTRRWGNAHPNLVPYQEFAAADGRLVLGVGNDGQYRRLGELLDLPTGLRGLPNRERLQRRDEVVAAVAAAVAVRESAPLLAALHAAGIPAAPLRLPHEALAEAPRWDPAALLAISHRELGSVRMVAPPWEGDGVRSQHLPPPQLGEGGEELATRWLADGRSPTAR